jgi:adenosylhomocysteine nucleosidase
MIGIIGALDEELTLLKGALTRCEAKREGPFEYLFGELEGTRVCVTRCGVGKVQAAMTTQAIISRCNPSALIFTGVAGALNPSLEIGDLVVGSSALQHDLDATGLGFVRGEIPYLNVRELAASTELVNRALDYAPRAGAKVVRGRILSGDQFITHGVIASHRYLVDELGGDAIEMEGASFALVCHLHQVPFLILRTISDKANHQAHVDFQAFLPVASAQSLDCVRFILRGAPLRTP